MKKFFALAVCLVGLGYGSMQGHHGGHMSSGMQCDLQVSEQASENPSKEIMDLMHAPMMCQEWVRSGDADMDFLKNMIPHHQGAILSAKALLKYSQDTQLREIAQNIIATQQSEIDAFNALIEGLAMQNPTPNKDAKSYEEFAKQAQMDMHEMMRVMSEVSPTGSVDKDFIAAMIPHHQGAIAASRQILGISKNPQIRQFAQDIITAQEAEVRVFEELLRAMQ